MDLTHVSDADILRIANPIMDNLMDASTRIDYEAHVRDFTERLHSMLPKHQFEWICRDYQSSKGYLGERQTIAIFRRPDSVAVIWRQSFSQQEGEFVAEMVLVQQDGRYRVDHVMVF